MFCCRQSAHKYKVLFCEFILRVRACVSTSGVDTVECFCEVLMNRTRFEVTVLLLSLWDLNRTWSQVSDPECKHCWSPPVVPACVCVCVTGLMQFVCAPPF